MVGTHNWHVWVMHVKHLGVIVNLSFIICKQLTSISFKNFCTSVSPLSKESISHENLSIKDISVSYRQILITFFCYRYIWKHKNILIITICWNPSF